MEDVRNQSISKEEINTFPIEKYDGPVHIIEKNQDLALAISSISQFPYIGFDTESKPSFKKKSKKNPIALVQLATPKEVYLIRTIKLGFPQVLLQLLSSPSTLKVGIAIHDDLKDLLQWAKFIPHGFLDISQLAKELKFKNLGLRSLAALLFKVRISKGAKLTNWELAKLSESQVNYASTDAWMSLKVYQELTKLKESKTSSI